MSEWVINSLGPSDAIWRQRSGSPLAQVMALCSAWNGRPWPGRSQNWMLMYFIINLSGSQQFSGSSIQNQVELSEWATGRFMHCLCRQATSPYLNQCWLIISKVKWHSSKGKFTRLPQPSITYIIWKIRYLKCHSNFPGANELSLKGIQAHSTKMTKGTARVKDEIKSTNNRPYFALIPTVPL